MYIKREDAKETIDTMICDNKWVCECAINSLPSEDVVRIEVYRKLYEKYVELKHELEQSQKDKWIPVSERLPDSAEDVLACTKSGWIIIASYREYNDQWIAFGVKNVIAWQPLPTPYKESEVQNESRCNTLP